MRRFTRTQKLLFAFALGAAALAAQAQTAPALQVAQQGMISATLQSVGGANPFNISLIFDTTGGATVNNPQDQFGLQTLFNSSAQLGTTAQSVPLAGGTAIQVILFSGLESGVNGVSSTGNIGKDLITNPNAHVSFGASNTATVTFMGSGSGFSISLGNVVGLGGGGGGCRV